MRGRKIYIEFFFLLLLSGHCGDSIKQIKNNLSYTLECNTAGQDQFLCSARGVVSKETVLPRGCHKALATHSDKGLMLKASAFNFSTVASLPYQLI